MCLLSVLQLLELRRRASQVDLVPGRVNEIDRYKMPHSLPMPRLDHQVGDRSRHRINDHTSQVAADAVAASNFAADDVLRSPVNRHFAHGEPFRFSAVCRRGAKALSRGLRALVISAKNRNRSLQQTTYERRSHRKTVAIRWLAAGFPQQRTRAVPTDQSRRWTTSTPTRTCRWSAGTVSRWPLLTPRDARRRRRPERRALRAGLHIASITVGNGFGFPRMARSGKAPMRVLGVTSRLDLPVSQVQMRADRDARQAARRRSWRPAPLCPPVSFAVG